MRLISAALAVALTPVFVALPTVSFASADTPRPVAPKVVSTPIGGIDPVAASLEAKAGRSLATAAAPAKALVRVPAALSATDKGSAGATVTSDAARSVAPSRQSARVTSVLTREQPRPRFTVAGISWASTTSLSADDVTVQVRVKEAKGWTAWELLPVPDDGPEAGTPESVGARLGTTPIVTDGGTGIQVRVDTPQGRTLPDLQVTTIDPGTSPADKDLTARTPAASASAAAAQPTIITRAQWGADESLRGSKTLSSTIKAITIHHTAGTNDYTPETAAAQVRGIYAYDTQGLGWADIAYNFLVDKWGRVYEGRAGSITEPVRGAHSMGFNTDTMGIAAIGNYETAAAPAVMVDALARVAGWKLSQYGVSPTATTQLTSQGGTGAKFAAGTTVTLPTVHAHQNTSYTLCPGKYLYPQMSTIRSKAATYALSAAPIVAPPPAPVIGSKLYATYGSLTLAAGSTGYAVRDLQLELNRRGYSVGTADGDFGAMTTAGVSAFQKAAQLTVTGKVAANDWKALSGLAYTKVAPAPVTTAGLYAAYGSLTLAAGATGWPVRDLQLELSRRGYSVGTADGDFGAQTTTAVSSFQKAAQVAVTGKVAANDWKALSGLAYTKVKPPLVLTTAPRGGFNSDGRGDVLGRTQSGDLLLYPVIGAAVGAPAKAGTGWGAFAQVLSPGDFDGDRFSDVLALTRTGAVWLYRGNGRGGFKPGNVLVGTGFSTTTLLLAPGDWTGDGKPDLLARKANGELWLLTGNGAGGFVGTARKIGTGWQNFVDIATPGDLTGDGRPDLLARGANGLLYLYAGTGAGTTGTGLTSGRVVGTGWGSFASIFSTGDLTGDGRADLLARTKTNITYVYAGDGSGRVTSPRKLTTSWAPTTQLFGVR
ncbi:peptidoglycan-binding protein [Pedococcus sp. KACC 23699]|uniref:Peptidoglycan-binding protein n=1 Tax=Pedococcus sp. KACC 23699 TaxID=3149228 RepID=A0AAU7JRE2_9MICO